MKLKYKLPIYYTIIGAICISAFGYIAYDSKNLIIGFIQSKFNESAKSNSQEIDLFINEKIRDLDSLKGNQTINESLRDGKNDILQKELYNYILVNNSFNYIELTNKDGKILARSDLVQRDDTNFHYIIEEESDNKLGTISKIKANIMSPTFIGEIEKNEFNQDSIDIIVVKGENLIIRGNLKIDFIKHIVNNNSLSKKSYFSIYGKNGKETYFINNTGDENIENEKDVFSGEFSANGNGNYNGNSWKIEVKQSNKEAYKSIYILGILTIGAIVFIMTSIIFLVIVIAKNFTTPLGKLLGVVKEISECNSAECNYNLNLDTDKNDEIGILAKSFNKMLGNIKGNIKVLNEYKGAIDVSSLVSKTDSKGVITYVNDIFCNVTGYTKDELIGKPHSIVRHPDNTKELFEDLWRTIKLKKIWKGTIKNLKKDKTPYWTKVTIAPIVDINGNTIEYISIGIDITELEKTKEELKGSYEKLQESTNALVEKERIGKEFELAEQIQNDFLPKKENVNIKGLDIHFGINSATEIGGDLYDVIESKVDPNKVLFYIGDVTGHGLISGMMMAICNSLAYSLASQYLNLVDILKNLNYALFHKLPSKIFITMVMLQYDVLNGTFKYLGAGHERILVYRKLSDTVEEIKSGGDALGMFKNTANNIKESDLEMNIGDIILLYTDGINEARNKKQEFYGIEKFKESFKANAHRKTEKMYESMLKDLYDFIDGAEIADDITMVIIKKDE